MHIVHVLSSPGLFQLWKALSIDFSDPLHLLKEPIGVEGRATTPKLGRCQDLLCSVHFYFRLTLGEFVIFYFQLFKLSFHYLSSY